MSHEYVQVNYRSESTSRKKNWCNTDLCQDFQHIVPRTLSHITQLAGFCS